ncbi:MAG: hypothetical protein WCF84_22255 [Anaerolineae bacterium]
MSLGQPVFSIKPVLKLGTILVVYILLGAVVSCAAVALSSIAGALFAFYPDAGIGIAVLFWLGVIGVFTWKLLHNYARVRYDFYPDRLEEQGNTPRTIPYARLGHLAFDGHQTLMLYPAFEGTAERIPLRIDIPAGLGNRYFTALIDLFRRDAPDRLFSYALQEERRYSIPPRAVVDLDAAPVHRLVMTTGGDERRRIAVDDSDTSTFSILPPGAPERRAPFQDLLLIHDAPSGEPPDHPLLVMNLSEGESDLTWQVYWVWNGQGVLLGRLEEKRQVPLGLDLKLELPGETLTLSGNLDRGELQVLRGGQPTGVLKRARQDEQVTDTLTLDPPLGALSALALLLALTRTRPVS